MATRGKKNPGRSAADEALALGLARGLTLVEAATAAHVSERTASRRVADPAFQSRVTELRGQMVTTALGLLADALADAAATMRALLRAKSETVKLSAARSLFEMVLKIREQGELAERIATLEQMLASGLGQERGESNAIPITGRVAKIGSPDEEAAREAGDRCRPTG